ncbi:MAG: DUF1810 domain-containing protein [Acidobacteriota bacterium]|nr:DUF1810 domain-containing protein [Acidobacteriota bacterium]
MTLHSLERFTTAQDDAESGFEAALAEIQGGRKRSHWIWYVFPQLSGLGGSQMSQVFGIDGASEAEDYLRHPVLSVRLLTITIAVAEGVTRGVPLVTLMGSRTDVLKLVSSLTLFGHVARQLYEAQPYAVQKVIAEAAETVLRAAESQGYHRCEYTLERLANH